MSLHNGASERKAEPDAAAKVEQLRVMCLESVTDVRKEAKRLITDGWGIIPLRPREKRPCHRDWPKLRVGYDDVDTYFPPSEFGWNLGIKTGEPSRNRVDIDLDAKEVLPIADEFLPPTGLESGREGKPRSHRWYEIEGDLPATKKFPDPGSNDMLLEFRSTGGQTAAPPSVHPSGERYVWEREGQPARVGAAHLLACMGRLAAAAALARYWPEKGTRQDATMALAGGLFRLGWKQEDAEHFLRAVMTAAGDDEDDEQRRESAVAATYKKAGLDKKTTGWNTLRRRLRGDGRAVVRRVLEWLGTKSGDHLLRDPVFEEPIPLGRDYPVPAFPADVLPYLLVDWAVAVGEEKQVPLDLVAMLVLTVCGAALAKKYVVQVRPGWKEPTNLFSVTGLRAGERKSTTFEEVLAPVEALEKELQAQAAAAASQARSARKRLDRRLRALETEAENASSDQERAAKERAAQDISRELAALDEPVIPQLTCDNETPESLEQLLSLQGGRVLQASPEGTAFEIAKGRYSKDGAPNFDVYLKGHAGDTFKTGRVTRGRIMVEKPALSVALTVQPDVVRSLGGVETMRGKGFLARWLYALPDGKMGHRDIVPAAVPDRLREVYRLFMTALWQLEGHVDADGNKVPHVLRFSPEADRAMQEFQAWLEPQLGPDGDLVHMSDWGAKLAGAVARIAGILHVTGVEQPTEAHAIQVCEETVRKAIRLGKGYLLPHARAAFDLMREDALAPLAKVVLAWLRKKSESGEYSEYGEYGGMVVSQREIHQGNRRRFETAGKVSPVLGLLVQHGWLQPTGVGKEGKGSKSPTYFVNPAIRTYGD
jgi:hypothetical protein